MHGVILEHVSQIVGGAQIIDAYDLDVLVIRCRTEYHTADSAKTIDTNFNSHNSLLHFLSNKL